MTTTNASSGSPFPRRISLAKVGVALAVAAGALLLAYFGIWQWMICRVEVPPGKSLMLYYKGPFPPFLRSVPPSEGGMLVRLDDRGRPTATGILEVMPGPGRYFYNPWEYSTTLVPDTVIPPGKLGVVTSNVGKPLPHGAILADSPEYKGIWRRVLTPGRYRLNTAYAYKVEVVAATAATGKPPSGDPAAEGNPGAVAATMISPGYVGVVTNKAPDPANNQAQGIQAEVLQPGLYFLNPAEKQVDVLLVGYKEYSVTVRRSGPQPGSQEIAPATVTTASDFVVEPDPVYEPGQGIDFPAADGSTIHLDFTAIWGIMPEQAPDVVRRFGTLKDVETKVVAPQINSVCRLYGSKRRAVELLVGDTREEFQDDVGKELEQVLKGKDLTLLFGLTRHIYVPARVREPIQRAKIADELRLTRDQEQLTAKAQADLTEAIAKVSLEEKRTQSETQRLVAEALATGAKSVAEIEANTTRLVAAIDAQTALVSAQIERALGEADAKKVELVNEAQAERFGLYVQALGGPENYNRYSFAEGLPKDLRLGIFYAGPGTFWTDLQGFDRAIMGKIASESQAKDPTAQPKPAAPTSPTAARP